MMKDNIWAFANALSQVCVEDDSVLVVSSCEFRVLTSVVLRAGPRKPGALRASKRHGGFRSWMGHWRQHTRSVDLSSRLMHR